MSFFDRVNPFRQKPEEHRQVQTTPLWEHDKPQWETPNYRKYNLQAYQRNALLFSCIREISTSISEAKAQVVAVDDNLTMEIPDHPLTTLLSRPNDFTTGFEFWEALLTMMLIDGNGFVFKVRGENDAISELFVLRPDWVALVPEKDGARSYIYSVGGDQTNRLPIAQEDMIHFKYGVDPLDSDGRGISPTKLAFQNTLLDNDVTDFMKVFFDNAAVPSGIIKLHRRITDRREARRIQAQWQERYQGIRGWHAPAVMDEDADFERLGLNFEQLQMEAIRNVPESRICSAFQVPPILVGANVGLLRSTYSNYESARSSFWEETLAPMYEMLAQRMSHDLLIEFPGSEITRVQFDLSGVSALQKKATDIWERSVLAIGAGFLTVNEARRTIGMSPVAGGDVFYVPTTHTPVTSPEDAEPQAESSSLRYREFVLQLSGHTKRELKLHNSPGYDFANVPSTPAPDILELEPEPETET